LALFLITALVLGMRHALDPDHLVAVTTLVSDERRINSAARLGLIWGIGHLVPIAAIGLPVILLRLQLPEALTHISDLGVGVLLVLLGLNTLYRWNRERVQLHPHTHSERAHLHPHASDIEVGKDGHTHQAADNKRKGKWTFLIGLAHGLAGTGPIAVLALASAPTVATGILYLAIFGIGTCLGMFLMTLLLAGPFLASLTRFTAVRGGVRIVAGLASIAIGALLWVENLPELL